MNAATNSMFFSGETEAQAVLAAANHFGVSPDQLVFDRVEKRHGFVKRRRVVIRVDPSRIGETLEPDQADGADGTGELSTVRGPGGNSGGLGVAEEEETTGTQEASRQADETPAERPDEPGRDNEEILEAARAALRQLVELADLEVSAEVVLAEDRLEVELEGVDQDLLVEDEGQVLLALQHLLPRVMYGRIGRIVPCRLDSGGYQRKKEERLQGLARRVAEEVVRRGGTRTLRPMNPADRRIVHLTLADDPDVETESQGNGYFKRVNVRAV